MAGDPSNFTLLSLVLGGVGAVLTSRVRSELSDRQQLYFGFPFVAGIVAVGEFSGLGQVLGSGALLTSFVVGLILHRLVSSRGGRSGRRTHHAK